MITEGISPALTQGEAAVINEAIEKAKAAEAESPFAVVLDQMLAMHNRKGADYGTDADPFANVRASEDYGVPGWAGCLIRANDKMRRLQKAARQTINGEDVSLANEGVRDSLIDLAVYAVIATVLWDEERGALVERDTGPERYCGCDPLEGYWCVNHCLDPVTPRGLPYSKRNP